MNNFDSKKITDEMAQKAKKEYLENKNRQRVGVYKIKSNSTGDNLQKLTIELQKLHKLYVHYDKLEKESLNKIKLLEKKIKSTKENFCPPYHPLTTTCLEKLKKLSKETEKYDILKKDILNLAEDIKKKIDKINSTTG